MVPSEDATRRVIPSGKPGQAVQWVIAGLLAVIAVGLWVHPDASLLRPAQAQGPALAGARGVFAFTGPLDREQYGLFMLDVDQGTVWCYGFDRVGGTRKLRLIAARTWVYDRYLQDFNCAEPSFREVQALVQQQRTQSTSTMPGPAEVDAVPGPAGRSLPDE